MKKIIYLVALIFAISSCDDKKIKESSLPDNATTFINTYFPDVRFSYAEKEKDDGVVTYDVTLVNGAELKFTESGEWISVDCKFSIMPEAIVKLIPTEIGTYLTEKHVDYKIVSIEKEMGGFEIGINNYANDIFFDANGTFIRYDNEIND